MKITASTITSLLEARHSKDVFVPECKNGPTHSAGIGQMVRMDAWAMKKSWTQPLVTAYEIKVSRSDFMRDAKWHAYLEYCNEFYFVCPPKLIDPSELPPEAGLIYVSNNGAKLFTKKRAVRRDVAIPESVYRYILMCRAVIQSDHQEQDKLQYWRNWLDRKVEARDIGYMVTRKVRDLIDEVHRKNHRLEIQIEKYEKIKRRIDELGFDPNMPSGTWDICRKLSSIGAGLPADFDDNLQKVINNLQELRNTLRG